MSTHCNKLTHTATHCNILQHTATPICARQRIQVYGNMSDVNTLQHTATRCNTLQHTATHCNTLQHVWCLNTATHCNTLQHTATHCNMSDVNATPTKHWLQHTTPHCNTPQHTSARNGGSRRVEFFGKMFDVNKALGVMQYVTNTNYNRLSRDSRCFPPPLEKLSLCQNLPQVWCAAVCCSVLLCVASELTFCSDLQWVAVGFNAVRCSGLQCAAVCCSVLQCVVACCSVLQCIKWLTVYFRLMVCVAVCRCVLHFVAEWTYVSWDREVVFPHNDLFIINESYHTNRWHM